MMDSSWNRLRRAILIAAVLTLLACGAVYASVSEADRTMPAAITIVYAGDANQDFNINSLDITVVERMIVGLEPPSVGADANMDGDYNALDITRVERFIAGLDGVK